MREQKFINNIKSFLDQRQKEKSNQYLVFLIKHIILTFIALFYILFTLNNIAEEDPLSNFEMTDLLDVLYKKRQQKTNKKEYF